MKLNLQQSVILAAQQAQLQRTNNQIKSTAKVPYIIKKSKIK